MIEALISRASLARSGTSRLDLARPDIDFAVHTLVWYANDPKKEHANEMQWLV